ncbi:MAG: OmpA family protein [Francisellaceae bacterium]|nr:OmpA family protein [Francisellaceae bacterium]MBT6539658.1 OmpA family protein [Francisellaceae bacterium]
MRKSHRNKKNNNTSNSRWLISYADFITLLFAFFVVMYSVSSVSEGKYKKFSESLEATFDSPMKSVSPLNIGKLTKFLSKDDSGDLSVENNTVNNPTDQHVYSQEIPLNLLEKEVELSFKGLIRDGRVNMKRQQDYIEIEIKSSVLFYEGGASLKREAEKIMFDLANVFKKISNFIIVEGYTDNNPISTELYPSNWELSSTRATVVIRKLVELGVDIKQLSAMAFGSNFPIDTNGTDLGRKNNRRVTFIIEKKSHRLEELKNIQHEVNIEEENIFILPELVDEVLNQGDVEVIPEGNAIEAVKQKDGSVKFSRQGIKKIIPEIPESELEVNIPEIP